MYIAINGRGAEIKMNMKKIGGYIGLLFMMIFLTSCPVMEPKDNLFEMRIKNLTSQTLSFNVNFDTSGYNKEITKDSVKIGSESWIYGFGFEDLSKSPFDVIVSDFTNKHIIVTTTSGDTLANWNDSSAVFNQQYWLIEHQESGDVHCTLQLTDEVLKLR